MDDEFTQNSRLHILEAEYRRNPKNAITSFIGTDAKINKIEEMNYLENGYVVVDVNYTVLGINPIKIYYVKKSSLKLFELNSNKYVCEINKIPVLVTIISKFKNLDVLPIRVRKSINTNTKCNYYGLVQQFPTNAYSSIISFPEKRLYANFPYPDKLVDKTGYKVKFTEDEQMQEYKDIIDKSSFSYLITGISRIKSFNEVTKGTDKAYVLDVNDLPENINGVVYCIQKRKIFDVMFVPVTSYIFTTDDMHSLKSFMYYEYKEYEEFYGK